MTNFVTILFLHLCENFYRKIVFSYGYLPMNVTKILTQTIFFVRPIKVLVIKNIFI